MPLSYDPEYLKAAEPLLDAVASVPKPAVGDTANRRAGFEALLGSTFQNFPDIHDVERSIHHVQDKNGHQVPIHRFIKKSNENSAQPGPSILHIHGGGYICLSVDLYSKNIQTFASTSGVQIFSVDYRVAPEFKFPVSVEDCYLGLQWVQENTKEFNVDPSRIAVMGDSAGGGLAAAVAIMARDRGLSPPLAKQILFYPMLDDRNIVPKTTIEPFASWNNVDNITGRSAYIGDSVGKDGVSSHAAPSRVDKMDGLAPAYIETDLHRHILCWRT